MDEPAYPVTRNEITSANMDFCAIILCVIVTSASVESLQVEYWKYKPKKLSQACGGKPCLMKCCPEGEIVYNKTNPRCRSIKNLENLLSNVSHDLSENDFNIVTSNGSKSAMRLQDFHLFHGRKCLNLAFHFRIGELLESGELQRNTTIEKVTNFCVDLLFLKKPSGFSAKLHYRIWDEKRKEMWTEGPSYIYSNIGRFISMIFLLLVLLVYSLLKRLRDNLFGVFVMAYVSSMAMRLLMQCAIHLYFIVQIKNCRSMIDTQTNRVLCPIYYFFCITSFFWLTFMSFSIWRCFRSVRNVAGRSLSGSSIKKSFIKYWAAAWGMGGLMTGTLLVLDQSKSPLLPTPNFEECLKNTGQWYMHVPLAVCITCNVIFYTLTFVNMRKIRVDVKEHFNKKLSKKNRKEKSVFVTSVNMFLIMGASWIIDVVLAFTDFDIELWQYILLTSLNEFNGVVIFIILVLKKRVIVMLRNKFKIKNKLVMNLVDSKATTRMDTKYRRSLAKSSNDSVVMEECSNFSQSDAGDGKQTSMKVHETIPEVSENDWDATSDQRAGTTTFKSSNFVKPT